MNKTCKDCIHYEACANIYRIFTNDNNNYTFADVCRFFKDKSRCIELPCVKGDVLQYNSTDYTIDHWNVIATSFSEENKLHLFGLEEAEKALKGGAE